MATPLTQTPLHKKKKVSDFYRRKWCGIYVITEVSSGRRYVGQSKDIFGRWSQHSGGAKSDIGAAFAAGPTHFRWQVVEVCNETLLNERERHWIEHFDCVHPAGFNKTSGNKNKVAKKPKS